MKLTRLNLNHNQSNKDLSIEMKRKKLIEKIAISLKLQHNLLFIQSHYSIKDLIVDLKDVVSIEDLNNTNYDSLFSRVEQIIMEKLSKTNKFLSKSSDFTSTMKIFRKRDKSEDQKLRTISFGLPNTNHQTVNQIGTWSKIAKFIDMRAKDIDFIEKINEKEKKRKFNESLMKQVKDKELVSKKENDLENTLIKKHFEYVSKIEEKDKQIREDRSKKIKDETKKMMNISLERSRIILEEKNKQRQEGIIFIEDLKKNISNQEKANSMKKEELREKNKRIMKLNVEEYEKRKICEKKKNDEIKLIEKLTLDAELKHHLQLQKINRLNKMKKYVDEIRSNLRDKQIAKINKLELNLNEIQKIRNEIGIINRKGDEKENERKAKQDELRENVNQAVQKQLIEKKLKIINEKETNMKLDKDILKRLDEKNELEREKSLKQRIKMYKYKEELEEQVLRKDKDKENEMSPIEKRFNKQLLEEMVKYNSPLHKIPLLK